MIDRATIEKIKDTADIVEVVSDYVHLTRRGANYVGLCPFHNERTPSFSVSRSKNFCYCFSCHKGGSPVNFIMEKEGISYHDALLQLARKYNIEVEERQLTDEERRNQSEREAMFVANEWTADKMVNTLHKTQDGQDIGLTYLYGRGITAAAVEQFRLGYCLDSGNDIAEQARKSGFDLEVFHKLGILGKSKEGRYYDRFRGRVIFPIINTSGKVVGFGGRDLKGGPAKYINSPESAIYKKSNELYGIFQAKGEMVRQDQCYLVEGYLDVIGMWQAGLKNVVASSGTALTDGQIALIHRFTNKITLIYDGDAAGIKASLRGIDMLLRHRMEVKVLLLPDGHDPHSFSLEKSPEDFREYIKSHETDIIRFQTKVLLDEAGEDPQKRITAANSVVQSIASIPDALSRTVYIQECAIVFGLPESAIATAVEAARKAIELRHQHEKEIEHRAYLRNQKQDQPPSVSNTEINPGSVNSDFGSPSISDSRNGQPVPTTPPESPQLKALGGRKEIRRKKEMMVAEQCLKYGLLPNHNVEDFSILGPDSNWVSVAEFIKEDLESDSIEFAFPIFSRLMDEVIALRKDISASLEKHLDEVEKELRIFQQEEIEKIATSNISMQGIEMAEKKLSAEIIRRRQGAIRDFLKSYPSLKLASHEDDELRKLTTELLSSPHRLSNIYVKDQRPEDLERMEKSQMDSSILRSIRELKNEILEEEYLDMMSELRRAVADHAPAEKIQELQLSLAEIIQIRSILAKELGERAVSPTKMN